MYLYIVTASVGRFQEKCGNIKSNSSPQGIVVIWEWEWQVDDVTMSQKQI